MNLAVAISAVVHNNNILLTKRIRGDYLGYWSLPGGKIEENEHASDAAVREVEEETGIKARLKKHLGNVSELLVEGGKLKNHFLLHFFELVPETTEITRFEEEPKWFELGKIKAMKNEIIPSDFLIIEKMLIKKEKTYYNCIIEKNKQEHNLVRFE